MNLLDQLTPYQQVRRGGLPLAEWVARWLPDPAPDLERLAFLILRPDCLRAGQGEALVDGLRQDHGMELLELAMVRFQSWQFHALYRLKLEVFGDKGWLHDRVYASGPAAALLLRGPANATRYLNDLKGPSGALAAARPEHLRRKYLRASSYHAIMHNSENVAALLYEVPLFLAPEALRAAIAGQSPELPDWYWRTLIHPPDPGDWTVFQAVAEVRHRIAVVLRRLQPQCAPLFEVSQQHFRALEGLDYLAQQQLSLEQTRHGRALLVELLEGLSIRLPGWSGSVAEQWRGQEQSLAPLHLLQAYWWLSGQEPYALDDGARLFQILEENHILLSDWQRGLVAVGLLNDMNPEAHFRGVQLYPA